MEIGIPSNDDDMSMIHNPSGATPIEPDDLQYLIPHLTNRQELNAFEQHNIAHAINLARRNRKFKRELVGMESLTFLHYLMFNETWTWAGRFRSRATNIGVEPHQIQEQIAALCADAKYWIDNATYKLTDCAVRVHHRLAKIHPFVNGNGRHARLVADLMMLYQGQPQFTWGGQSLDIEGTTRNSYLAALKKADAGNYKELLQFAVAK